MRGLGIRKPKNVKWIMRVSCLLLSFLFASCSTTIRLSSFDHDGGYTLLGISEGGDDEGSKGIAFLRSHDDKNIYVDKGNFSGSDLFIPSRYKAETVTGVVDDSAFANDLTLTSVTFSEGLTSIGNQAFMNTGIASVTLPSTLTSLGNGAFMNCPSLSSINIASCSSFSFTSIPEYCFAGDTSLADFSFPNQITSIGASAFQGCSSLERAMLPWSLLSLGDYAYSDCTSLNLVYFSSTMNSYGEYAFLNVDENCQAYFSGDAKSGGNGNWNYIGYNTKDSSNRYLRFVETDANIGDASVGTCTTDGGTWNFLYNYPSGGTGGSDIYIFRYLGSGITNLIIPLQDDTHTKNIIGIRPYVFQNNTTITSITLSDNVKYLEEYCFSGCTKVKTLKWSATSQLTTIGYCAFWSLGSNAYTNKKRDTYADTYYKGDNNITYQSAAAPYAYIPADSELKDGDFVFPNTLTSIETYAFQNAGIVRSVIFRRGGSVNTSISSSAFLGCRGLSAISFSEKVTSIGELAFALVGYTYDSNYNPNGFVTMEEGIKDRQGPVLHSVFLPSTIATIGGGAFHARTNCCLYYQNVNSGWETSNTNPDGKMWNRGFGWVSVVSNPLMTLPNFQITSSTKLISHYYYEKNYFDFVVSGTTATLTNSNFDFVYETNYSAAHGEINNKVMVVPKTVTLGSDTYNVTNIERGSFANCYNYNNKSYSLTSIYLPSAVTEIFQYAAGNSQKLSSLNSYTGDFVSTSSSNVSANTFPSSLLYLGKCSFFSTALVTINLPSALKTMVFNGKTSIASGGWTAADDPFINVLSMAEFSIVGADDGTTQGSYYSSYENALYSKDLTVFHKLAPKATSLVLSPSCSSIDDGACKSNTVLTTASLNDLFTSIPTSLFAGDTSLSSMKLSKDLTAIGDNAFSGCTSLANFLNTGGVTGAAGALDCSTLFTKLTSIGANAFNNCDSLTSFKGNSLLSTIGEKAFFGANGLVSVVLPSSLTSLGASSFAGCSNVTSLTISTPSSLLTLGNSCFSDMDKLTSLTIPSTNITAIPNGFVEGSATLSSVNFGSSSAIASLGYQAFANTALSSIVVPSSINTVGERCFANDTTLTSLTFAAGYSSTSAISINDLAFKGCTGLTKIVFPAGASFSNIATQSESPFLGLPSTTTIFLGTTASGFTAAKYPYNLTGTNKGSVWNAYLNNSTSGYTLPFYVYSSDGTDLGSMNSSTMPGYKGWWNGSSSSPTIHNV